jgi:hypothetical protein
VPLPSKSNDVDPISSSDEVVEMCYAAMVGSTFDQENGWHINLMPETAMQSFPVGWADRAFRKTYGKLTVIVPSADDVLVPKLLRRESRDLAQAQWALEIGILADSDRVRTDLAVKRETFLEKVNRQAKESDGIQPG